MEQFFFSPPPHPGGGRTWFRSISAPGVFSIPASSVPVLGVPAIRKMQGCEKNIFHLDKQNCMEMEFLRLNPAPNSMDADTF